MPFNIDNLTPNEKILLRRLGEEITVTFVAPGPSNQGLSVMTGYAGYLDENETELGVFNDDTNRTLPANRIWNFKS